MHDESNCDLEREESSADFGVLNLLLGDDTQRPWTVEEVARDIGDRLTADDSLARLYAAGLVHRLDGFVFATRPAGQAARLLA
jgi:predicted transcriptional regulator